MEKLKENIARLAEKDPLFSQFETDKWVPLHEATALYNQLGPWEVRIDGPDPLVIRVTDNNTTIVFCGKNRSDCIHYLANGGIRVARRVGNDFIRAVFDCRGFWARTPEGRVYEWA